MSSAEMSDPAGGAPETPDLEDARWFPVDLHVPARRYGFLRLDDAALARSSFLDTRIEASLADATPMDAGQISVKGAPARLSWLFHTSFCGSTLLARALHVPPHQVCLKEPLVLRRMGDARHAGVAFESLIAPTLRLLARPWHPGGDVVVKPTHAALNVASALLAGAPDSKAVFLTSSLDDFLVSNLKKTPETQAKIPDLAERALSAGSFHQRLPAAALAPPDLLCAAGLQWAAQRELMQDIVEAAGHGRVRAVDMRWLLRDLEQVAWQCMQWLGLPAPRAAFEDGCRQVAMRNAKAIETPYGPGQRMQDMALVTGLYAPQLAQAGEWLGRHVIPSMRPAAFADPQPWYPL